jgi:hypothetical protein
MSDLKINELQMALKMCLQDELYECTCDKYKGKNVSGMCNRHGIVFFSDVDYRNIKSFCTGETLTWSGL